MARKAAAPVDVVDDKEPAGTEQTDAQKKLLERALKRWKLIDDYWQPNLKTALEAIKFRAGAEWPEDIKRKREEDPGGPRPCLSFRRGEQYIRQIVNDGRQNRPAPKYRPIDGGADVETANALQGIVRSFFSKSNADEAFDCALEGGAGNGFGYFRILTEYANDGSFELDIVVKRIRNPLSVRLAPHQAADGSDAEDGFVVDDMGREEFKRRYPQAKFTDWKLDEGSYADDWLNELTVRVAEYFYKEEFPETLYLLEDGQKIAKTDYDLLVKNGAQDIPAIVNRRQIQDVKVMWCRMSGAEILEENEFPSRYIPIFPVYGTERDVNGKVQYEGSITLAMDSLRLYNFERSAYCEGAALAPKVPFIVAEGQTAGHPEWETANDANHPYLTYNQVDVDGKPAPKPTREQAGNISAHYAQSIQITERDIQSAFGMYNASIGAPSNEKSGRAITARQREGDVSTFHYHDNLNRAVRHAGRVALDMIPRVIDTRRAARMLGEDGDGETVIIDPALKTAHAMEGSVKIFNPGIGRYDSDVSSGPSYTTQRQESADAQLEMTRANPAFWQTHGDLIAKNQDWPGAEEFAERSKALMPPEMKAAIAAEKQGEESAGGPPPEVKAIMDQAQGIIGQKDQQIQQMGQALSEAQKAADEAKETNDLKAREVEIKAYQAETERLKITATAMGPEQVQQIVLQMLAQLSTPGQIDSAPIPEAPPMGEGQPMPMQGMPPEAMPSQQMPPGMPPPDMGNQPMPMN